MNLDSLLVRRTATFHDSVIERIELDYLKRNACLHLQINTGDPDAEGPGERDRREAGALTISGLLFLVMEPPDETYPYQSNEGLWIKDDEITSQTPGISAQLPWNLPQDAFVHRFFVDEWNSFIYVAGTHAEFAWK